MKISTISIVLLIGVLLSIPVFSQSIIRPFYEAMLDRGKIQAIKDFIIYYGNLDVKTIEKLSKYDVVIIEPRSAGKNQILSLKEKGTKVYGYLSVVEQNENNLEFVSLKDDWFYKVNGDTVRNDQWESWYMDLSVDGYRRFLIEQIYLHVVDKNLDGVFIDTVGDIEEFSFLENEKVAMTNGYVDLLKDIKINYEDVSIIQNWGFNIAKEYSKDYIDGIMWEGFNLSLLKEDKWSKNRFEEIKEMNIDFYMVSPIKEPVDKVVFNKDVYRYYRNIDIYDEY